jgi:hypothetical protein
MEVKNLDLILLDNLDLGAFAENIFWCRRMYLFDLQQSLFRSLPSNYRTLGPAVIAGQDTASFAQLIEQFHLTEGKLTPIVTPDLGGPAGNRSKGMSLCGKSTAFAANRGLESRRNWNCSPCFELSALVKLM